MRNTDKKKENMVLMSFRISAEDKEQIEEKARKTGLSTSEYIRRCALGRKLPCYGDTSLLKEYSIQLGKIGSNLNQIAKHLNGGGDFYSIYYGFRKNFYVFGGNVLCFILFIQFLIIVIHFRKTVS